MLPTAEIYGRLAPRVRALASVMHDDREVDATSATVRFAGVDHRLVLGRDGRGRYRITVKAGRATVYRGALAGFYAAADRERRKTRAA